MMNETRSTDVSMDILIINNNAFKKKKKKIIQENLLREFSAHFRL